MKSVRSNKSKFRNIENRLREWEDRTLKKSLPKNPEREILSELPVKRLYTPLDNVNFEYLKSLGFPGEYPYTRGIHATMYRGELWSTAQYSGFGTPEETNRRWKFLLNEGQRGLSLACDLPTQLGYDPDDPLAEAEVGAVGASCSSLKEMEILFDGIPQDKITMRCSINAPHIIWWSMYIALAEKKGIPPHKLRGSVSSDPLGEYIARKAYIFPPRDAMRLSVDVMEYCLEHVPHLNYFTTAYIVREAGSTLIQECAFGLAMAMANLEAAVARGIDIDAIAPKMSFIFAIHMNLFEEVAKFRALRRLWAKIMKEEFGANEPSSWRLRVGPGTGAVTLPAQQPENNIVRVTLEALAGVLGGVQYLHTSAFDEAYAIPTERSVKLALRTQQILAYESGVANLVDPLGGSYYIEALTDEIENAVLGYLKEIEKMGGIVKVIESGWVQDQIDASAYQYQKEIEEGKRIIVGVNKFCTDEQMTFQIHQADPKGIKIIKERLEALRRERNEKALKYSLARVREAAQGTENLMPSILEAVKNYATMGEICGVLREVFGEFKGAIHV